MNLQSFNLQSSMASQCWANLLRKFQIRKFLKFSSNLLSLHDGKGVHAENLEGNFEAPFWLQPPFQRRLQSQGLISGNFYSQC